MKIDPTESFEERKRKLASINSSVRLQILAALLRGETVDLAKDPGLYYAAFGKKMDIDDLVNRVDKDRTDEINQAKMFRKLNHDNKGYTDKKSMRHIGEIPADIFFSRPEFHPSNPNRAEEIRKFLIAYPAFKVVDKL
jgi:hypothetical protein